MHRIVLTGATGFVGGNVAAVLNALGAQVLCAVRRDPGQTFPWPWRITDLSDTGDIASALTEHAADAVIHLAIDSDLNGLYRDRRAGYDSYVGMTRRIVDAANASGCRVGYVSTDWVFDGSNSSTPEDMPVSPVNLYGLFKALSEQTVLDRADASFIARVSGVQGRHLTRPESPRQQDCGFGNLVLAVVDALSAGTEFTVWTDHAINNVASPIIASEIAALLLRAVDVEADGILHLVGADAVTRRQLAEATCAVFGLDAALLRFAPPPADARLPAPIPFDTSLSTARTEEVLGAHPASITDHLEAMRRELATGRPCPLTSVES